MAGSSETLHEAGLSPELKDRHRAIVSIQEELEAIDWYDQRVEAAADEELREILAHNRDEEKEHAVLLLEWLRRRDPKVAGEMESRLFAAGPLSAMVEEEEASDPTASAGTAGDGSLGIGSLKEVSA